jgi:hypothetical protein
MTRALAAWTVAALVAAASVARAAPPPPARTTIAIAPGAGEPDATRPKNEAGEVLRELAEAVRALPSLSLVTPKGASSVLREADPIARAQALGRELKTDRALAVDLAPLGDGLVVYLHLVEVQTGVELGSANATLVDAAHLPPDDRARLRSAAVRVLEPARYVGRVKLRLDVAGAQAVLDGAPIVPGVQPLELAVGTHALRVTHPAYHDFLRFIDVEFDRTLELDVALSAYPLSEGQMTEHRRAVVEAAAPPPSKPPRTWRWWVIGASVAAVAAGIGVGVYFARPSVHQDLVVDFHH